MKIRSVSSVKRAGAVRENVNAKPSVETYSDPLCDMRGKAFDMMTIHKPKDNQVTKINR